MLGMDERNNGLRGIAAVEGTPVTEEIQDETNPETVQQDRRYLVVSGSPPS